MKIVKDKKYPDMYRVKWKNGDISVGTDDPKPWEVDGHYGFYNKARAKEIISREGVEQYERGPTFRSPLGRPEKPAGEFYPSPGYPGT